MIAELLPIDHRVASREISFNAEWWPEEFGSAYTAGLANGVLYAVFSDAKLVATSLHGSIQLYDTGEHAVKGLADAQDDNQSLLFETDQGFLRIMQLNKIKV
jgi:hypothetical protein